MIQLIAYTIQGDPYEVDVNQDEVILLNKQFLDLTDLGVRNGTFTKSFALPATRRNDIYFGLFGDPSTESFYFNTEAYVRAVLVEDSFVVLDGNLKLNSADGQGNYYNVSVFGTI
ncbi:unnamed protein product, partial [marine sediment metagenome]